jgi:CubicO group peptidase (beta-lactamase class C family)
MKLATQVIVYCAFVLWATVARGDHIPKTAFLQYPERTDRVFAIANPAENVRPLQDAPADRKPADIIEKAKKFLESTETFSLILLENGNIVFEGYANGSSREQRMIGMSMSKSAVSLGVGEALCAGKIENLDDVAGTYAKDISSTAYGKSSIKNLLKMTSGAYDGVVRLTGVPERGMEIALVSGKRSLLDSLKEFGSQSSPQGERWVYKGFDTEAAAFVVEGATGLPFHKWFEQSVWKKVGAEANASWSLTKDGRPLAQGTFAATARDWARLAAYVLDRSAGKSGDACMDGFVKQATSAHSSTSGDFFKPKYGYQFWIDVNGNAWMIGHQGKEIALHAPTQRAVISLGWSYYDDWLTNLFNSWIAKP